MKRLLDGSWQVSGPRPLIGLVLEKDQRAPIGDVRFEMQVSTTESPSPFTLLLDTGAGFAQAKQVPLPAPEAGVIAALVTLPEDTVALGLHPGSMTTFRLGALGAIELTAVAAMVAHAVPQVRRLLREPARFALLLGRAIRLLRQRGTRGVVDRLRRGTQEQLLDEGYAGWARRYGALSEAQLNQLRARLEAFRFRPTISLLLTSDQVSEARLRRTVEALEHQVYPNWELCVAEETISDELRSVFARSVVASQIRWASGMDPLATARGEVVARLVPGDALAPQALFVVAEEFNRVPNLALLYADSDSGDATDSAAPSFKPDWSPAWLQAQDYIGRAAFFLTEGVRALGGWRSRDGEVSHHELLLRYTSDLPVERISHVPAVLLHSPPEPAPTAAEVREGVRVIQASLDRVRTAATAEPGTQLGTYRIRYAVPSPQPLVTVVIPTRDNLRLLKRCVQSVREVTTYRPLELLVVDNDSRERGAVGFLAALEADDVARVLRYPHPFNYSAMNNLAAREAHGALLCLLNNDVEAIDPGWLTEMVGLALQPGIGAVGAKLLYPNNTIQHAGMVCGTLRSRIARLPT